MVFDRSQLLAWLSPLEPWLRHQVIRERRVKDAGDWVLQTEEFRSWYAGGGSESDSAVLLCYGDPGVGKTYISSLVIDRLCDQARGQNVTVACFYFDFAAQKEQSSTSVLGVLLKQVVGRLGEVPEEVEEAYEYRNEQRTNVAKMLQTASSRKRTFICIDALDECMEGHRVKLLDSLNQILQNCPGTRIFVTGRPHIRPEIGRRLAARVMSISIRPKRDDIVGYVHTRLGEDTNPDAMDSGLEADILGKIPQGISETFLLVSLNIDAILQETTIHRRRQKLSAMTDWWELGDAYDAAIGRIGGQGGEKARLGMAALMWISHSERPLEANELCHALAVEIGLPDLNADNVPSIGTLLACCQGLVVVDRDASTIRFIHFTLHEYLQAHPEFFGTAHSKMAETCLSYLNSQQVNALSTNPSPDLRGTPFLKYSSLYWGMHAKKDLSDCAKSLALRLFDGYDNHISIKILLAVREPRLSWVGFDRLYLFNGLHYASMFGIVELVADLVEVEGCDINQKDCAGYTPLVWAACEGHEGVVEILLERDNVNPKEPDPYGQTPLWCAIENGHEGVVKILLRRDDINPNKPDRYGRKPLWFAVTNGHEGVVKMLLERDDVNPNEPDAHGETPLCWAAQNGHEGVVEMLLGRNDVNPDRPDVYGRTPLWSAADSGHGGVVEVLLGRISLDIQGGEAGDLLRWAVETGHEGVVKALLGRDDISPDELDVEGQSPLRWAACSGHGGVVKILLERDDVNPNELDPYGLTPLYHAAGNGYERVVKILLGRDDVNPDKPDEYGQTPLYRAAGNGHEEVVRMLLRRGDINPDKPDSDGQTPLLWAAKKGHEAVVKILLGRDDVNPYHRDKLGRTPLWWATERGLAGAVALLRP